MYKRKVTMVTQLQMTIQKQWNSKFIYLTQNYPITIQSVEWTLVLFKKPLAV